MPRGVQIKTNYDIMISNRSYRDLDRPVRVRPVPSLVYTYVLLLKSLDFGILSGSMGVSGFPLHTN